MSLSNMEIFEAELMGAVAKMKEAKKNYDDLCLLTTFRWYTGLDTAEEIYRNLGVEYPEE